MTRGPEIKVTFTGDSGNFVNATRNADTAVTSLSGSVKNLATGLAGAVSASAFASKLVAVQREFDVMNASLITMTGSTANAQMAFAAIQQFAATTPYSLQEVTSAFTKLKSLGLDPSQRALESYGNTAAAMGKGLDQFIEAVADASTSEFERLKEFGIKASQEGGKVSFTFQGVTTTVKNSAAEINEYLTKIGENEFSGAMAERAKTLDGAISNLSDTWDNLFLTVSQKNTGGFIFDSVKLATGAVDDLTKIINAMSGAADDNARATGAMAEIQNGIGTVFETVAVLGANVAYVFRSVGTEIGGLAAQAAAVATGDFSGAKFIGEEMKRDAAAARAEIDALSERILGARTATQSAAASLDDLVKPRPTVKPPVDAAGLKTAKKEADELAKLMDRIYGKESGLDAGYWNDLERLNKQFQKTGDLESYADAVSKLTTQQRFYQDQVKAVAKAEEEAANVSAARFAEMAKTSDALQDQVSQLRLENDEIGLTAEQLDVLRIARMDDAISAKAQALAVAEKTSQSASEIEMLREQIEAMRELRGLTATGQVRRANARAIEEQKTAWSGFFGDISRGMTDSIFRSFEAGESRADVFFDSLQRTAATTLLKFGVEFTADAGKQLLGLALNALSGSSAGGGSGGLGSALGLVSNASSAYGLLSGQTLANAANMVGTGYGAITGSGALGGQAFAAGLANPTASEAAMWAYQSAFQATGDAAMLATAEGIAAGQGAMSGFISSLGTAAIVAAPLIIGGLVDKFGGGDTFQTGVTLDGKYSQGGFSGAIGENYKTTSGWFNNGGTETYLTDINLSVRDMIGMLTSNAERQVSRIGGEDYYTYKNTLTDEQYNILLGQIGLQVGEKLGKVERQGTWVDDENGFVTGAQMVDAIVPVFKTAAEMTEAEIRTNWSKLVDINNNRYLSRDVGDEFLSGYTPSVGEMNMGDGGYNGPVVNGIQDADYAKQILDGIFGANVKSRPERLVSKDLGTYDAISTALDSIYDQTVTSFEKLGTSLGATDINAIIAGYTADITIDNVGGIKELLTGAATQLQEGLGKAIFPVIDEIRTSSGETGSWAETFSRVSAQVAQVGEAFKLLDVSLTGTGLANDILSAGNALVTAFGGLETLQATLSNYYENYYTAEEKRANVVRAITESLAAAGAVITETDVASATREQFRDAYEAIVETAGAASPLAVAMLKVESAFAGITPEVAGTANAINQAASTIAAARQKVVTEVAATRQESALDTYIAALDADNARVEQYASDYASSVQLQISAQQQLLDAFEQAVDSIRDYRDSLMLSDLSVLDPEQKYREAKRQFEETYRLAQLGNAEAIQQLPEAGRNFLTVSQDYNATTGAYVADYQRVLESLDKSESVASRNAERAQDSLVGLERQMGSLNSSASSAASSLLSVDAAMQSLLLEVRNSAAMGVAINQGVLDALNKAGQTGKVVETGAGPSYTSTRGASAFINDAGQLAVTGKSGGTMTQSEIYGWAENAVKNNDAQSIYTAAWNEGLTLKEVDSLLGLSAGTAEDWAKKNGLPTFRAGGYHVGGVRMVGEGGPELEATGPARYWSFEQTRAMMQSPSPQQKQDNSDIIRAIEASAESNALGQKALIERISFLEKQLAAIESSGVLRMAA
ncbi:tape measure protein [Azonexus sp.]|uniref:tape measure protein n=1 Tax=Azonexus sp. TaxID=1872668 RepID=UPI0027BA652F|nr:tape measure protein [Azonexus sp.]